MSAFDKRPCGSCSKLIDVPAGTPSTEAVYCDKFCKSRARVMARRNGIRSTTTSHQKATRPRRCGGCGR